MNKLNELLSKIISKLNISVKAEEQIFTEEQKARVRENIGAGLPQVQADYSQNDATARDYIKNRPVYIEQQVLTYDGNPDIREETTPQGIYLVKVSDELIDFNNIKQVTVQPENGEPITVEITPDMVQITTEGDMITLFNISYNEMVAPIAAVATFPPNTDFVERNGTYLCGYENEIMIGYVSRIEFQENIHKLDIKYLPDGGFGYSEVGKVINTVEWDGIIDNRFQLPGDWEDAVMVRVSDEPIEVTNDTLKSIKMNEIEIWDNEATKEAMGLQVTTSIFGAEEKFKITAITNNSDVAIVKILHQSVPPEYSSIGEMIPAGIYFISGYFEAELLYTSSISAEIDGEIIHKINPKYYDRLAWEENDNVFELTDNLDSWKIETNMTFNPKEGIEYEVQIDDNFYRSTARAFVWEGMPVTYIGNGALFEEGQESTEEPFLIGAAPTLNAQVIVLMDIENPDEFLTGEHTIRIFTKTPHKIDEKFLPYINPDWNENNTEAKGYIKNRPFYDGPIEIKTSTLLKEGAPFFNLHGYKMVKIMEYMEKTEVDFLFDSLIFPFYTNPIRSEAELSDSLSFYSWQINDVDVTYFVGISEEYASSASPEKLAELGVEKLESGIYGICVDLPELTLDITYIIPLDKKITEKNIQLSYNNLKDIPFGDIKEEKIDFFYSDLIGTAADLQMYWTDDDWIYYKRIHNFSFTKYEDLLGQKIFLKNGEVIEIKKENIQVFLAENSDQKIIKIADKIFATLKNFIYPEDVKVNTVYDAQFLYGGIYSSLPSDDDETRAIGMTISKPYTKQIDSKFLPIATSDLPGAVKTKTKTMKDVQPVAADEDGNLFVEPVAYDGEATLRLLRGETVEVPFNVDELIGLKVVDSNKNRWVMNISPEKPELNSGDLIFTTNDNSLVIAYGTHDLLNKPYLLIGANTLDDLEKFQQFYPQALLIDSTASALIYVYETTQIESVGATLVQGWYLANLKAMNVIPVELKPYHCIISPKTFTNGTIHNEEAFTEIFTNEDICYTITADNIYDPKDLAVTDKRIRISYADQSIFGETALTAFYVFGRTSFVYDNKTITLEQEFDMESGFNIPMYSSMIPEKTSITYPIFKQIDPKFLPMDIITSKVLESLPLWTGGSY